MKQLFERFATKEGNLSTSHEGQKVSRILAKMCSLQGNARAGIKGRGLPAELLETVDCCDASSTTGFPSGPMDGGLLLLRAGAGAGACSADSNGAPEGVRGCGVEVGGGMLFCGLSRLLLGTPGARPAIPGPLGYICGPE